MAQCWSDTQLAAALRIAGVNPGDASYLVATAHPESGGCAVVQQGQPYATTGWGPWQITPGDSEPRFGINSALLNLQNNADAAAAKLDSQGLGAWTTINDGAYSSYFPAAKTAVAAVYNMPQSQVAQLAKQAGSSSTQQAQTTGLLSGITGDLFSNMMNDIASSLGLPSPKDMMIRLGLILFGAVLVIVGIVIFTGRGSSSKQQTTIVPLSGASKAGESGLASEATEAAVAA
jgi:hypothetical protein